MAQYEGDPEWGAVYCLFRPIDEDGAVFGSAPAVETCGYFFARHLVLNLIGNGSGMMMRRDIMLAMGGFDPVLSHCEDLDVQLRISKRYKIALVREYLVGYRQHPNSASKSHLEMAAAVMSIADKHTSDRAIPEDLRKATFAAAHRYLWFKYLKGGATLKGIHTLLKAIIAEPAATLDDLTVRAVPSLSRRITSLRYVISSTDQTKKPHFFDLEPTAGITPREPRAYARLSKRFKKYDEILYERFADPRIDEK